MIRIPDNIEQLRGYTPGKPIAEIIAEYDLKETAVLWNNENNLGPSPKSMEKVQEVLSGSHLYPDPACLELREGISKLVGQPVKNIIVGNGSEGILANIYRTFFGPGDELLTSAGSFVAVYIWASACGIPTIKVPQASGYAFDLDAILDRVTDRTKMVYLANPNNPTGAMIEEAELLRFIDAIPPEVLVVVDEAYYEFAKDLNPDFPDSTQFNRPNVLTLRTFSKTYGIAGIRIGYGVGPASVIEPLMKVKLTFAPSNVAQAAGIGALEDTEYLAQSLKNNRDGVHLFYEAFDRLGLNYIPSYGNFVMLDLGDADRVQELFQKLMKQGVFVRPLQAFGLPHCLRITVGTPSENQLCIAKLQACL